MSHATFTLAVHTVAVTGPEAKALADEIKHTGAVPALLAAEKMLAGVGEPVDVPGALAAIRTALKQILR